ncbi:MAG: CoA transferase [Proteobacteria bacterium]|nr:CoA transferase [Pseudomonadota bacterium]
MMKALDGVKVLDLARLLPGNFCTLLLADYGADVLKIEDTERGDYGRWYPPRVRTQSAYFLGLNRNKKSMKLNLKADEGKAIFMELVQKSDVILEGFRPGVTDRLGIGYDVVRRVNPAIIYCSISGFGQDGPYRDKVGHDINYIGIGGILGITGQRGGPPVIPASQIADIGAGGMMATIGILMALVHRRKTGKGQYIDISMLDGVVFWLSLFASKYFFDAEIPERGGMMLNGELPCYRVYKTKDGKYITIGALEEKFWKNLCQALGRENLIPHQYATGSQGDEVVYQLEKVFLTKTRDEWVEYLDGLEICHGPVNNFQETFSDPQVLHRKMVLELDHPTEGHIKQLGFPIKFSETPGRIKLSSPGYGEHTKEVLLGLGYTDEKIEALEKSGVI